MNFKLLFLFLLAAVPVSSQPSSTPCFNVTKISRCNYLPSKKGTLKPSPLQKITFKVEDYKQGKVLRSRMINQFFPTRDSLTSAEKEKIEYAVKQYRIAFLGNHTHSTLVIPTVVGSITIIQEAQDKDGHWRPIEYINNFFDCGTGIFNSIELEPMEFIEIYPRKYCGSLFTNLRMKLLTVDQIFLSEEYEGYVNPSQFDLSSLQDHYSHYYGFIDRDLAQELERTLMLKKGK